jgi:hypothetical protein
MLRNKHVSGIVAIAFGSDQLILISASVQRYQFVGHLQDMMVNEAYQVPKFTVGDIGGCPMLYCCILHILDSKAFKDCVDNFCTSNVFSGIVKHACDLLQVSFY